MPPFESCQLLASIVVTGPAYFTEGQWAPHPGTGEEVRFSASGMCSTTFAKKFYDVDCDPLNITDEEKERLWNIVRSNGSF